MELQIIAIIKRAATVFANGRGFSPSGVVNRHEGAMNRVSCQR